jgi:hypothetical protein
MRADLLFDSDAIPPSLLGNGTIVLGYQMPSNPRLSQQAVKVVTGENATHVIIKKVDS